MELEDVIIFSPEFNEPLDIELISNYKKVIFSDYVLDKDIFKAYMFDIFTKLIIQFSTFNQEIKQLPQSITQLTFGNDFNQELSQLSIISQTLTHLTFGNYFNKEVNQLSQSLTHLIFGMNFNQEVNVLPNSITNITFGFYFNRKVNNLPQSITRLTFGFTFNQEIKQIFYINKSISNLTLDYRFNQKVDLPLTIVYLKLNCNNTYIIDHLSSNIKVLNLDWNFNLELNNLPSSIKKIFFHKESKYNKELNCLPKFVEQIQLPKYYNKQIKKLPFQMKKIICHYKYIHIKDFNNCEIEIYY